ncbi:MAG: hypothetical protein DLD55_05735, partial [candidate division SR1 bacterium]
PDFTSAEEAVEFAKEIQRIAKRNQLSDADMGKGQLRVDVNISSRKEKTVPLGTRVELKNIKSFSAIKRAIDAEVIRQLACRESGEEITQQTRRRDDLKGQSFAMRSKKDAFKKNKDLPFSLLDSEDEEGERFEDTLIEESEVAELLQQDFELEQIKAAMQELDVLSREIIFLKYIEHKSNTEIEEQLLISQEVIRQRISRAFKKLRALLKV